MIIKSVAFTFAELLENIIGFQPLKQQYILHSVEDRVHTKLQQLINREQSNVFLNIYDHFTEFLSDYFESYKMKCMFARLFLK